MKNLFSRLRILLGLVYTLTLIMLIIFLNSKYITLNITNYVNIIFFAILVTLTESFTAAFRHISFSTSFAIQLAAYILFGPMTTLIIMILGYSFRVIKVGGKYKHIFNTPVYGTLFNYCIFILATLVGNYFYINSGGSLISSISINNIASILTFCITFYITNILLISSLYSIMMNKNIIFSLMTNLKLGILNIFIMVPLGMLLAIIFSQYNYIGIILVLFPIFLARSTFNLYIDAKTQYTDTVNALMLAMEARDKYTEGHSQRVADLVEAIARQLKYSDSKIEHLRMASMLHDVGKIGIDDNILNKPGKLTDDEYNIIKKHPEIGYNILKDIKNLSDVKNIVKHHHERYDGKGYPDGLDKDSISIDVFIVQLADSIDAMATDRPYRKALSEEKIISELKKYSGTQFHPKVVEAYLRLKEKQ